MNAAVNRQGSLARRSPKTARPGAGTGGLIGLSPWSQLRKISGFEEHLPLPKIGSHHWMAALQYVVCDMVCWVTLYGFIGYARRDAFFVSPFEFVMVDFVALGALIQALYIVGGYNRNTETRTLTYTAEHILAIAGAAVVSSLLIYSAATFDA
jgi:hypothetical protein